MAHDWGTTIALDYERRNSKRLSKLVILDVFPEPAQKSRPPSWKLLLLVFLYQSWLIFALLIYRFVPGIGQRIGNLMTWMCAYAFNAPGIRSGFRTLSAAQNFYYVRFWQGMMQGAIKHVFPGHAKENGGIRRPEVPLLFIYGTKKPVLEKNPYIFFLILFI